MIRPIDRNDPEERAAALRLLRLIGDGEPRAAAAMLTLDDILAHGLVDDDDNVQVCVGGIPMRCKIERAKVE